MGAPRGEEGATNTLFAFGQFNQIGGGGGGGGGCLLLADSTSMGVLSAFGQFNQWSVCFRPIFNQWGRVLSAFSRFSQWGGAQVCCMLSFITGGGGGGPWPLPPLPGDAHMHALLILSIGLPLLFGYLKLRVLLVNEPFSLAWSPLLN